MKKTERRGHDKGVCFFSKWNNCWMARLRCSDGKRIQLAALTRSKLLEKIRLARELWGAK